MTHPNQCAYQVRIEKELARGILEPKNPFEDADCRNCPAERQSRILCYHYIDIYHLEKERYN